MRVSKAMALGAVKEMNKTRFRYRKGQWRRRTIVLITEMGAASISETWAYAEAARLCRFGIQGERHLKDAKNLEFSPSVLHDIRMMLLVIASFSSAFKVELDVDNLPLYKPSPDLGIWDHEETYSEWTVHTRRQFHAFVDMIKEMQ